MPDADRLPAEARARRLIDDQLEGAGWVVQSQRAMNLFAGVGIAVREFIMAPGHGRADYLLFVDRQIVGVIEAKPVGTSLSGVEWQSAMYATGLPDAQAKRAVVTDGRLPIVFESSGVETHFTNGFDPYPRTRRIFAFPQPATVARQVREAAEHPDAPTWRARVHRLPGLDRVSLRPAQIDALEGVERALREQRFSRSLIQMATGAGKTFTAVTEAYRLLAFGGFTRVLFLVDRNNLADQSLAEFQNFRTPGDGRRFTELYPVTKLTSAGILQSSSVVISTIQRLHRVLQGKDVEDTDDPGIDDFVPDQPVTVAYNSALPPEAFDLLIVDEAHRSIYGVWRGVLEYFDAHIVGLTATPGKQTFGFFQQNLVSEYSYPESVADGVNVDFDIYRIKTRVSDEGGSIEAGTVVPKVHRRTRKQRLEALDEDLDYTASQLDQAVTNMSQLRTILETYRDRMPEIFPGRRVVPKTLIFCKDDNHAETVVNLVREVFGKGNDFAAKITYNAKDPKGHLQAFRTSPTLRVAVTVDMIATGTDVKPLECVFFLRDVRSAQYFEQMKGRGARTIPSADFQAVTPDATQKTRFVIVDAVGVTEHDFVEPPLNRDRGISLQKLLARAADLSITEDETATLASRLSALELHLTASERGELDEVAGGSLRDVIRDMVDAVDPDTQVRFLPELVEGSIESAKIRDAALAMLIERAVEPLASNPELRSRILELRRTHDQVIDEVTVDELVDAYGIVSRDDARSIVASWRTYLAEHRNEISAIQVLMEAKTRHVPFASISELADRIARPPRNWTVDLIWQAYATLHVERVRPNDHARLTDLVSLLRYELGEDRELVPYADVVMSRYGEWLSRQVLAGIKFTKNQRWWLDRMADVIANSAGLSDTDLDTAPFTERGGVDGVVHDFGAGAGSLINELNAELTA